MTSTSIPVITVSYNTPELLDNLLSTFREKYPHNPFYVIDGSDEENLAKVKTIVAKFNNVFLTAFGYNIHHGPGMAWAINNLPLTGPTLFLDSDIEIVRAGFIENLLELLKPNMYGVGAVGCINREGFNVDESPDGIQYLHPICMLCNIEVVKQWPLPIKHGAPMTETMLALHDSGMSNLLKNVPWVMNDISSGNPRIFIDHKGQGTVFKTGGYHLEEWMEKLQQKTSSPNDPPIDLENYNKSLLSVIPNYCRHITEIGCQSGALAAAYKNLYPQSFYQSIAFDEESAQKSRSHCDKVLTVDIDSVGSEFFSKFSTTDCWVIDGALENLKDPWTLLKKISHILPPHGVIVASIFNSQYWGIQAKINAGELKYEDNGLINRSHLRWFSRASMLEMFAQAGLQIAHGHAVMMNDPLTEKITPAIRFMAEALGQDPELAVSDALPLQYIIQATSSVDQS
ncbi:MULTISPECIES: methyltransferase domain-containing protein [Giesbergeria]|uniref:Methyltransferase domain-containing protein n=1 Tax=Giesbergeria sinuosa TaxID=80883 RepID=A0ABV9Q9C1_9BURK